MRKKPRVIGFDLETGNAEKLYSWDRPEPYIVLCGWIEDGITHVTTDPLELLRVLVAADTIYGHNIYAFDIPALVLHALGNFAELRRTCEDMAEILAKVKEVTGVDYEDLMAKAVDTMVLAHEQDPPAPKGATPILYSLEETAKRLKVPGKSDQSKRLAEKKIEEFCEAAAHGLEGKEAAAARRAVKLQFKDVYDASHLIAFWDPELIEYLEGDLTCNADVFRKMWHHMNRAVARDELENFRALNRMTFLGCRIDRDTADEFVAEENAKVAAARIELTAMCPGIPEDAESPLATTLGGAAFEKGLLEAGVDPEDIPRTPKSGKICTARDALSEGDWVVTVPRDMKRYDPVSRETYIQTKLTRERRQGLRQKYPDNYKVQKMCELATIVSGKSRKFAEIRGKMLEDDMVHAKIGDIQASLRIAFVKPSITNVGKRGAGLRQRSMIVPRRPGEVIMCSDLSQGDMRIMAALSQDPEYMKLFIGERDAHAEVAVALLGTPELQALAAEIGAMKALLEMDMKYLRDQAKAIGHGVNYGMGIDSTIANTGLPREIVERYFEMRAQTYRVLNRWTNEAREEAKSGWIQDNGFGHKLMCEPSAAHTQGPALYGQSGTREIIMHGIRQMPAWVQKMLVMVVHDEVVLSVPADRYEEIAVIVQESLRVTWRNVFFDCDVSNPGENWGQCYDGELGKAWQKHFAVYKESMGLAA